MSFFDKVKRFFKKTGKGTQKESQDTAVTNHNTSSKDNVTVENTHAPEEKTSIIFSKSSPHAPTSLLLLKGPEDLVGVSWILDKKVISVGRSFSLNDITVPHPNLSKKHFQILKEKEEFYVVDLKSTNGTSLNDENLTPYQNTKLKDNDYIRASSVIFKFLEEGNIEGVSSKKILDKASTDALTGIGNRQLLNRRGLDYFHFENLSMIVFDIDKFKSINDNLGHSAGDYVLKMIVQSILEVIREDDLFIRYGGDEFCILSPESLEKSYRIAERIRYKVENLKLVFDNQMIYPKLSLGVAEKLPEDRGWEDVYHRADKLSYDEKNQKKRD